MPRRRKAPSTSRRKPKAPDGDEGADLEAAVRREKMQTLLADFDTEMNSFRGDIREMLQDFEKSIECVYMVEISKLPRMIRDMKVDDYMNQSGSLNGADKITQDIALDIENNMLASLTKTKKKDRKKRKAAATSPTSEESSTVKKQNTRKRKKAISSAVGHGEMLAPTSTMRPKQTLRQRNMFETPAHFGGPSALGWETPLITPKFDPRLPVTPAMARKPKAGEIMMSLAGSPLANQSKASTDTTGIVVGGQEINLSEMPDLSEATMEYLKRLREKLNTMPLTPTQH